MADTQDDLLAVAHEAARAAAAELNARFGRVQQGVRTKSGPMPTWRPSGRSAMCWRRADPTTR
jgi:hypothetical protein